MDVEEYFPESISEIHCDESRKDETTLLGSLHCHICYQELGDLNPVKHFKPCKCSRIYVHRNCANQKSGETSACSMCGSSNTLSRIKQKGKNQDEVCIICKKSSKDNVRSHMIQPCFCGVSAHYDCLIPLLDNKSSCNNCGVTYQVFKKAPVSSFLRQHICHFICFILFLIVLVALCGLAVSNSYLITKRTDSRSILFTAWSLLLLISMIGIVIMIIRYTINVAFPRYQVEFGSVTVHPSQSRILPKDSINHRKFAGAVVMSDIVRIETGLSVIPEEDEEKSDSGRLDLTLGQHLFGIISVPNGHTSSTPIEDSSVSGIPPSEKPSDKMDADDLELLEEECNNQPIRYLPKVLNGGISGIIGVSCVFPMDLVKTRLQNQKGTNTYTGIIDCFKKTWQSAGPKRINQVKGLYQGASINIFLITPEKAIKLVANDFFRHALMRDREERLSLPRGMLAGGAAGFCQVIITTPMELLKIRMQQSEKREKVTRIVWDLLTKNGGIAALYRGLGPTMARDITFSALYFPLFAYLDGLGPRKKDDSGDAVFWASFVSGLTAGAIASFSVTPLDVVKTRIQAGETKYKGICDAFYRILKDEGPSALFKGAICRMMVMAPLFAIAQTVYYIGLAEKLIGIEKGSRV